MSSGGLYLAGAGAMTQQMRLEVVTNNLANVNTAGYRGEKTVFRTELEAAQLTPLPPGEIQPLSPYAPPFSTVVDFSQGPLQHTGNPLDVAINGPGFFSVQTPEGVQYTRQGSFTLDSEGTLVTADGYPVLGDGGPITLEEGRVEISLDGTIYLNGDEAELLAVTVFDDPQVLKKAGNGRFSLPQGANPGDRPDDVEISQGYVEMANVSVITAMTEMIETSRMFELYQKVIQTADDADGVSISKVGDVS